MPGACGAMAATDAAVWVAGGDDDGCAPVIERIDPKTDQPRGHDDLPSGASALAIGPDGVWLGTPGALGRVDPAGERSRRAVIAAGDTLRRGGRFRVRVAGDRDSDRLRRASGMTIRKPARTSLLGTPVARDQPWRVTPEYRT